MSMTIKISSKAVKLKKFSVSAPKTMKVKATKKLKISKITPAKATGLKITFKSSKPKVLSVDKAGKLTAKKAGKVKITVTINKVKVVKIIKVKK